MNKIELRFSKRVLCCIFFAGIVSMSLVNAEDANVALPSGVVARQNGVDVTLQDVDAAADKIPEKDRAGFFDSPKRIEGVVAGLLFQKQLAAAAKADKLDRDPLVQKEIAQASDDVLARVLLDRHQKNLKLPDFTTLSKEYYLSHKDEFVDVGQISVEHVLVSTKNRSEGEAKAKINEILSAAHAHPDQFDALVEKYSDDPSKTDNHGKIDNAGSGRMAPPFSAAAKALKTPGEISPAVKTEFGYHVLKLLQRQPDRQKPFEEVRPALVAKMKETYIATQMDQYTGELRGKPLQANPDLVASLRSRYAPAGFHTPEEAEEARQKASMEKVSEPSTTPAH